MQAVRESGVNVWGGWEEEKVGLRIPEKMRQLASWEMAKLGEEKVTAHIYCPLKFRTVAKTLLTFHMCNLWTLPLPILPLHALWIHSRLFRCGESVTECRLAKYQQQVKMNQNSVKISLVQFSIFNTVKLTVDLETRVLDHIFQMSVYLPGHSDSAKDLEFVFW